jgi:hypothetical protein
MGCCCVRCILVSIWHWGVQQIIKVAQWQAALAPQLEITAWRLLHKREGGG